MSVVGISDELDGDLNIEAYMASLRASRVGAETLDDAIEVYARTFIPKGDSRDEFVFRMTEEPLRPQVHKAILDVILAVIAATELPSDEVYHQVITLLDVQENDDDIRAVKHAFIGRMADEDAPEEDGDVSPEQYRARMLYLAERIG